MKDIKISFGIIVLNGQPFIRYNLRQLYPFAHQIIVVEGASVHSKNYATPEGHSVDDTLEELKRFKKKSDPENKIKIITKEDFWSEKDEQSQAYARVATGNYLWQVDIDEFYKKKDIKKIISILQSDPTITAMSIKTKTYWGNIDYEVDSFLLQRGAGVYHRIFKWGKGYKYITHRPPTVINEKGENLRNINYLDGRILYDKYGIFMYHYSLLFPFQVKTKTDYYSKWARPGSEKWAKENYFGLKNPFRVHNIFEEISWLKRSTDEHPTEIIKMMNDIKRGKLNIELREVSDIEKLLNSKSYSRKKIFLFFKYKSNIYIKKLFKYFRKILISFLVRLKKIMTLFNKK